MANLLDKFFKRKDGESSGEKGVMIRDDARMKTNSLLLAGGAIGAMFLMCLVLLYKNSQLAARINREVYVSVDNKVYKALPSERGLDERDLKLFVKTVCANMFAHDQFSYAERTEAVRNLMNETTFNYILKKFEYHGQPITAYYKKFDARLYYTVSDTDIEVKKVDKNFEVVVRGKQRAVFAVGDPVESALNMAFFIREIDRTDENMFGLFIYNFNFIK
jgi:hypothetical protein